MFRSTNCSPNLPHTTLGQYLSLGQLARSLPSHRGQGSVSPVTLWRWACRGVRGVRLKTIRIGALHYSTQEWFNEFIQLLNANSDNDSNNSQDKPSKTDIKHQQQVETELRKLGV